MKNSKETKNEFQLRHIGPQPNDNKEMLDAVGVSSIDALMNEIVPAQIRIKKSLKLSEPMNEYAYLDMMRGIAGQNKVFKSFIGQGYYPCITPSVILRNIFENPGWYTQYTPYQPEISQGRLEALLNYQTMVCDLTGMQVANASLLDEGTAAGEAMTMSYGLVHRVAGMTSANKFFVSDKCFPQTIDVIKSRALPLDIEVLVGDHQTVQFDSTFFGAIIQYPAEDGSVHDYRTFIQQVHAAKMLVIVASDLLSLALLTPPGEFGADIVIGSSQRLGVPMGFGGPHAAFFATKNEYIRAMPGRIIGVTIDAQNNKAYRMTLQTREQHIRREKATSNICTAQALLAIMAGMYAVYHGPDGIRRIAERVHSFAKILDSELQENGFTQSNSVYFDTLKVQVNDAESVHQAAVKAKMNFRHIDEHHVGISIDETATLADVAKILKIIAGKKVSVSALEKKYPDRSISLPEQFSRESDYLTHPVFNRYHSETEMMRYLKSLENKDLSLAHAMTPLGSCTMKLNAATELIPLSWPEFSQIHPFVPLNQAEGYMKIFKELGKDLCTMTGFAAVSLMPNSGAQGEFTGLSVIRAYQKDHGQGHRDIALIPSSAHGTNPASAVMAGLKVVVVMCDDNGNIDVEDLRAKAEQSKELLSALIVTYPSTHGVFEERIKDLCDIIHQFGGLVYMDGANLNAQVGLTSPGFIGADVCHINLHKTYSIPHGGGGPGMGPICVTEQLAPYLPGHPVIKSGGDKAIHAVASAPWSSASINLISYGYIKMMGGAGLLNATKFAILNANYLKSKLESHYQILYKGKNGRVAHEFILNMKEFKNELHVEVEDIAKRLIDFGFHPPTVSFPVHDTLMIEPTESESKEELDRFIDAMITIRLELEEISNGNADAANNVLKNAPHSIYEGVRDDWNHPYPRAKALYPIASLRKNKFWTPVGRVNNTFGDKNLLCSCPPIEEYI